MRLIQDELAEGIPGRGKMMIQNGGVAAPPKHEGYGLHGRGCRDTKMNPVSGEVLLDHKYRHSYVHLEMTTGMSRLRTSPSLLISPNLDALLAHEELVRGTGSDESSTPPSAFPASLPPPPRHHRKSTSAGTSPSETKYAASPRAGSSSASNPYINPAPSWEEVQELHGLTGIKEEEHEGDRTTQPRGSVDGRAPVRSRSSLPALNDPLFSSSRSRSYSASSHACAPATSVGQDTDILRKRSRKLVRHTMAGQRQRPLLSHDVSPCSSFSSGCSSVEPASTLDDPRISIDSTPHPPDSLISHPHSMYLHADRHSFIDFFSSNNPLFSFTDPPRVHIPPHFATQPPSREPSAPTSPLTPKRSVSAQPCLRGPHDDRPPTSNLLDAGERAELIRKSRKLAQLFGQPPEADSLCKHDLVGGRGTPLPVLDIRKADEEEVSLQSAFDAYIKTRESAISAPSMTSFIDLSEDAPRDGTSFLSVSKDASSPSDQSFFDNMTPEQQAEDERRKKREKLAKLHRFLGSRVPANLVLGLHETPDSLPPDPEANADTSDATLPTTWLKRRRSSSAALPSSWSDDIDRLKEDLNDREKAINVRRAQKMEKVFGVIPPQTLFHTRHSPSPSMPVAGLLVVHKQTTTTRHISPAPEVASPPPGYRNPNRSAYTKAKPKKDERPGSSESHQQLIPKDHELNDHDDAPNRGRDALSRRASIVYTHFQYSLNSLSEIIDRDDRESLAELHEYLTSGDIASTTPPPLQEFSLAADRRLSNASVRSERRRSLPARTSRLSISSEYSIPSPKPEATDFQLRRRRAAKLTQFFGVDYRDLITDVLESIEHGLEHERVRGSLRPEEVEDLLQKLRRLRTRREQNF